MKCKRWILNLLNLPSPCFHVCALKSTNLLSLLIILYSIFPGPPTLWIFLISRFVPPPVTFLEEPSGEMGFRALRHRTWSGVSALLGWGREGKFSKTSVSFAISREEVFGGRQWCLEVLGWRITSEYNKPPRCPISLVCLRGI